MKTKILRNTLSGTLFSLGLIFAVAAASETLAATVPFPALTGVKPFGSLIYEGSVDGTVPASATQSFTLSVDASQTITVDVLPAVSLQATIELRDPSNNLIGSATAGAVGQEALLQTVPASSAGTYTITIGGANNTTGTFHVRAALNAMFEFEAHGGPSDDDLATAQDLASSAIALRPVSDRMAVLGDFDGNEYSLIVTRNANFELESNDTAAISQPLGGSGVVLGAIGNGVAGSDADWYSFSVNAGDNLVLDTTTPSDGPGEFPNTLNPHIELYDPSANLVATGTALADGRNESLSYTALVSGTYLGRVTGESGTTGEYVLQVQGATGLSQASVHETVAGLNVGLLDGTAAATDVYSFTLQAGQSATLAFKSACVQGAVQLQDGAGNVLATGVSGAQNVDVLIENFVATASGTYYAVITGVPETETTSLLVTGYPNPTSVGASHSFTVTAKTACGNTSVGYMGTIHFSSSDTAASLPADYMFTPADSGSHTFTATFNTGGTQSLTATDTTTSSITGTQSGIVVKTAADEINDLIAKVRSLPNVPSGTKNALLAKLNAALTALNAHNTAAACARMQDFINLVQAQSGKKIPAIVAAGLIADATQIRTTIGCP
jgi:Bacterial pre-peptidase C-terminal domain.